MAQQIKLLVQPINKISILEMEINEFLVTGWKLMGELKVVKDDGHEVLLQQLVFGVE